MKVFKFGGASVKDVEAVRNVYAILCDHIKEDLCVVFSAMGKTTNALEKVAASWITKDINAIKLLQEVKTFHRDIAKELEIVGDDIIHLFSEMDAVLSTLPPDNSDEAYDKIVSYGELLSTTLISNYLHLKGLEHVHADARKLVITNNVHRSPHVDWESTELRINDNLKIKPAIDRNAVLVITQGFIGSTINGSPVTLGREGSDFSAAIFAWALNAKEMVIWKDVPGVLNADPRLFNETVKLDRMSYRDAIELAYFGASVIHPKTIQPLQSKKIPLFVKPFYAPQSDGTVISEYDDDQEHKIPSYIIKPNQVLVSISPRDFSFIAEENLHGIFGRLSELNIHVNMMQLSAISFSIVIDSTTEKVNQLFELLTHDYRVKYNSGLELITIRYYDQNTIDRIIMNRRIYLEQKSRTTVQLVVDA